MEEFWINLTTSIAVVAADLSLHIEEFMNIYGDWVYLCAAILATLLLAYIFIFRKDGF